MAKKDNYCNAGEMGIGFENVTDGDGYSDECLEEYSDDKPVIYLYPLEKTDIKVKIDYNGVLTTTYPKYKDIWKVTAYPDGRLVDSNGKEYNYLFWEGKSKFKYMFDCGFCIKGEDTIEFLEKQLENLGLTRREINEFIVYWLPQMENNKYNLIKFVQTEYINNARLRIEPKPDTVIRVFMVWEPVNNYIVIPIQILNKPKRDGFTVVEWGGSKIGNNID